MFFDLRKIKKITHEKNVGILFLKNYPLMSSNLCFSLKFQLYRITNKRIRRRIESTKPS